MAHKSDFVNVVFMTFYSIKGFLVQQVNGGYGKLLTR
jgi:hypothetical protein